MKLPYEGHILLTSPYGYRTLNCQPDWHPGLDLVGQEQKIVRAAGDGVVKYSDMVTDHNDRTWEWGNFVCVHTGFHYVYTCHLEKRLVSKGQVVKAGDPIGIEGNTGYSFGQHCHFEVRDSTGTAVDPFPLLGLPQSLNRSGVTLYNTFKQPEPEPAEDDIDIAKLTKDQVNYLKDLPESQWSKDEGGFALMKELGLMDGSAPQCYTTREQQAAVFTRYMNMVKKMVEAMLDERLGN